MPLSDIRPASMIGLIHDGSWLYYAPSMGSLKASIDAQKVGEEAHDDCFSYYELGALG